MAELWYKNITFEDAVELAKENLTGMVETFIAAGYYLKVMKDDCERYGYKTIWECAEAELGLKKSEASRAMNMNSKYSVDGNTPYIQERYKKYNKSQLEEMLQLSEEKISEQVTPETTVEQVREIKREERRKNKKMQPDVRGSMDYAYCAGCGIPLDEEGRPEKCPQCGQLQDWEWYERIYGTGDAEGATTGCVEAERLKADDCCDVATERVITCSDGEMQAEMLIEIEEDPDREVLSVEFDTNELLQELDDVVDVDYQELTELSAYGLPRTEYPAGSLLTTEGCGHKYSCFLCAQDCNIRQVERRCVEATCGAPYGCETMGRLSAVKAGRGNECQFVNMDLAYKMAGSGEPSPCCKKCHAIRKCAYACDAARKEDAERNADLDKTVRSTDAAEEQQGLPKLKNDDQRKQWLRNYKAWGLWYRDENIDVNYYKFDFPDGSRLVVAEYPQRPVYWRGGLEDEHYFHLLEKNKQGYNRTYDERYRQQADSESYLVEFLKNMQKKGN